MIEIVTSNRVWSDEVAIWFVERDANGGMVYRIVNGVLEPGDRFARGGPMPAATLILPMDFMPKLLETAKEFERPTPATVRHLDDAIAVRDRLLTLVEVFTRRH